MRNTTTSNSEEILIVAISSSSSSSQVMKIFFWQHLLYKNSMIQIIIGVWIIRTLLLFVGCLSVFCIAWVLRHNCDSSSDNDHPLGLV